MENSAKKPLLLGGAARRNLLTASLLSLAVAGGLAGCSDSPEEGMPESLQESLSKEVELKAGDNLGRAIPPPPQVVQNPQPSAGGGACVSIAPTEKAEALLKRLFPKSAIHFAEPLPIDLTTCLLEVEMSVDADSPQTRGFVYVLPDGERFLNGPLMDKRSKVSTTTDTEAAIQAALKEQQQALFGAFGPKAAGNQATQADGQLRADTVAEPAKPPKDGETLRRDLLDKLSELPALTSGKAGGKPVHVLLDPQCAACQRLFSQRDSLAEAHNIEWKWIPLYTSEEGWIKAATVLKVASTSPEKAMAMLDEMMQRKWQAREHVETINGLNEADYALPRKATAILAEIAKSAPGSARTPMVVFERPNNSVEVIAGIPLDTDWLALGASIPSSNP